MSPGPRPHRQRPTSRAAQPRVAQTWVGLRVRFPVRTRALGSQSPEAPLWVQGLEHGGQELRPGPGGGGCSWLRGAWGLPEKGHRAGGARPQTSQRGCRGPSWGPAIVDPSSGPLLQRRRPRRPLTTTFLREHGGTSESKGRSRGSLVACTSRLRREGPRGGSYPGGQSERGPRP